MMRVGGGGGGGGGGGRGTKSTVENGKSVWGTYTLYLKNRLKLLFFRTTIQYQQL